MGKKFEIVREGELATTPEEYWDAVTTGNGGWLWPMEFEPRVGGQAAFGGVITAWDPPHHLASRMDGEDGWFNQVEHTIEGRGGRTFFRYVHSGVFTDDWDNQYDGAGQHTDFYLHTLAQYLAHFSRRPVVYLSADAPAASNSAGGFATIRAALGLTAQTAQDDTVRVALPGGETEAVVDYLHPNFVGLRTHDAMYRFFGRNAFGAPVGVAVHHFDADADAAAEQKSLEEWLSAVYA